MLHCIRGVTAMHSGVAALHSGVAARIRGSLHASGVASLHSGIPAPLPDAHRSTRHKSSQRTYKPTVRAESPRSTLAVPSQPCKAPEPTHECSFVGRSLRSLPPRWWSDRNFQWELRREGAKRATDEGAWPRSGH